MLKNDASRERERAIEEENRNLQYLRSLVDGALRDIRAGRRTRAEAEREVEIIRAQALELFPGKDEAFDLIYRPRFQRAINETFKLHC